MEQNIDSLNQLKMFYCSFGFYDSQEAPLHHDKTFEYSSRHHKIRNIHWCNQQVWQKACHCGASVRTFRDRICVREDLQSPSLFLKHTKRVLINFYYATQHYKCVCLIRCWVDMKVHHFKNQSVNFSKDTIFNWRWLTGKCRRGFVEPLIVKSWTFVSIVQWKCEKMSWQL